MSDANPDPISRYGAIEAAFGPSSGQTFAGVFVAAIFAVGAFTIAAVGKDFDNWNRFGWPIIGVGCLALGVWIWRARKWRFAICELAVVQVRASGIEAIRWTEVREFVHGRPKDVGFGPPTYWVMVVGRNATIKVNPINYSGRNRLFERLLAAAAKREIPIRIEWIESSD